MKTFLVALFALYSVCGGLLPSVSAQDQAAPTVQEGQIPDPGGSRAREFQGDDLGQVLRLLARQAKVSLAVGESVKGLVNMRLENVTALDAIQVLVRLHKLTMTKDEKSIYYIDLPEPATAGLDLLARPETADRVAAYKRNLYEALLKQKFSSGEALQLTTASDPAAILLLDRKPEPVPPK